MPFVEISVDTFKRVVELLLLYFEFFLLAVLASKIIGFLTNRF